MIDPIVKQAEPPLSCANSPTNLLTKFLLIPVLLILTCLVSNGKAFEDKKTVIKIAAIFSVTGKAKASNESAILGARLAVSEINQRGGIRGRKLELLLFDNKSTPIGSHIAAKKAVEAEVSAIIGSVWSSHSLAIAKVAQKHKVPMLSPLSTIPSLTKIGDYIFRGCYTDDFQGAALAMYTIDALAASRAIIFTDISSDFSINISKQFSDVFTSSGGQVLKTIEYKAGQSRFLKEAESATGYDADIVFLSGHDESGLIARSLQNSGVKAIPVGSDGWGFESFLTNGGNEIILGYYIDHWEPSVNTAASNIFLDKYGQDNPLMASTVLAYDSVMLLENAILKSKSLSGPDIREALHQTKNFTGVTGTITFDRNGDARKNGCIMKISNGTRSLIKCINFR